MALPDMYKDSFAPLKFQLQYQAAKDEDWHPIPYWDFLVSFQLKWSTRSSWTGTLTLFDQEEKFLSSVFLPGTGAMFRMKWGWDNDAGGFDSAPIFNGRILKVTPDFKFEGTMMTFELLDEKVMGGTLNRDDPPRKFAPGFKASEIAKQICDAEGWGVNGAPVIEDSVGTLEGFILGEETRWAFLLNTLLPRAHNDAFEAMLCFFDDQGVFHFHSALYALDAVARHYVYARDPAGEVMDFTPVDNYYFSAIGGGGDGVIGAIDSKKGKPIEAKTTADGGVQDPANTDPQQKVPQRMEGSETDTHDLRSSGQVSTTSFTGLVARTPEEAQRMSLVLHAAMREYGLKANMTVKGTHDVLPADAVEVSYYTSKGDTAADKHYLSGIYRIAFVEHTLDSSGWKTTFEQMYRLGLTEAGKFALAQQGPEKTVSSG